MTASKELNAALEAARAAEKVIRHYYRTDVQVELKEDQSPVTIADVESERAIKNVLMKAFPEHGFYGEETGSEGLDNDYLWLVDPIDGTKSFVRRYPFFSTQIALMHKGEIILGVSNAPLFGEGELAWAERGQGAFLNGQSISVSDIPELSLAALSLGNIASLARSKHWAELGEIVSQVHRIRGYGDFYHYHLLAAGKIDAVIESDVNILDIAALSVIVEEAGGLFRQLDGGNIGLETTAVMASNNVLGEIMKVGKL